MRLLKRLAKTGTFTSSNVYRLNDGATRIGMAVGSLRANLIATTGTLGRHITTSALSMLESITQDAGASK